MEWVGRGSDGIRKMEMKSETASQARLALDSYTYVKADTNWFV